MTAGSAGKIAQLGAFLGQAPASVTLKLAQVAGVFAPCATLVSADTADRAPRRGRIAESSIPRVWAWLVTELAQSAANDALSAWTAAATGLDANDPQPAIRALQSEGGRAILNALRDEDEDRQAEIAERLGGRGGLADARDIGALMAAASAVSELLELVAAGGEASNGALFHEIDRSLQAHADVARELAPALLRTLAAKSGAPIEIVSYCARYIREAELRPAETVAHDPLVEIALDRVAQLSGLTGEALEQTGFEVDISALGPLTAAFTSFALLLRGGAPKQWRRKESMARADHGDRFARTCGRSAEALRIALPSVETGHCPLESDRDDVLGAARFIVDARSAGTTLEFEQQRRAVEAEFLRRLKSDYADSLLRLLNAEQADKREIAAARLEILVELKRIFLNVDSADVLAGLIETERGEGRVRARFFKFALPLIMSDEKVRPRRGAGAIPSSVADALWERVRETAGATRIAALADEMRAARNEAEESRALKQIDELRAELAPQLLIELTAAEPRANPLAEAYGGIDGLARVRNLCSLLECVPVLDELFAGWPPLLRDLDEATTSAIRRAHDRLIVRDLVLGPLLLIIVSTRLARPAHIFRAVARITRQTHDYMVERTDFAAIGDWLLDEAEAEFRKFSSSEIDITDLLPAVERFAAIVAGMTEEFEIRKSGRWGERLFKLRAQAGSALEIVCRRAIEAVADLAPKRSEVASRHRTAAERAIFDGSALDEAAALVQFLRRTAIAGERAAFAAARVRALADVTARINAFADTLIEIAQDRTAAGRREIEHDIETAVRLVDALDGAQAANVLKRRAAAAG